MKLKVLVLIALSSVLSVNATLQLGGGHGESGGNPLANIISPILSVKVGALNAVKGGINSGFDAATNKLQSLSGSIDGAFGSFGELGGGHSGKGKGKSGHSLLGGGGEGGFNPLSIVHSLLKGVTGGSKGKTQKLDFDNDNSFKSVDNSFSSNNGYVSSSRGVSSVGNGHSYSPNTGYSYPAPSHNAGGSSWSGSSSAGLNNWHTGGGNSNSWKGSSSGSWQSSGSSSTSLGGSSIISGGSVIGESSQGSSHGHSASGLGGIFGSIGNIPKKVLTSKKDIINKIFDAKLGLLNKFSHGSSRD